MNDIVSELYKAWKSGRPEIVITLNEFNQLLLVAENSHVGNESVSFEHHRECPSVMHEIDMVTSIDTLKTGHYATYRDTLKIIVKKKVDNNT